MPWIDILLALYVSSGFRRGRKRGPATEMWKALRPLLGGVLGIGAFKLLGSSVSELGADQGYGTVLPFLAGFGGALILLLAARKKIREILKKTLGETEGLPGAVIGLIRTSGWSLAGLSGALVSPLHEFALNHSFIASLLAPFIGVS